jgi:hypothetical protein
MITILLVTPQIKRYFYFDAITCQSNPNNNNNAVPSTGEYRITIAAPLF